MLKEIRIGVISSSHGIKGEAKVFPTTDDIEHFKNIKSCTLVSAKSLCLHIKKSLCI